MLRVVDWQKNCKYLLVLHLVSEVTWYWSNVFFPNYFIYQKMPFRHQIFLKNWLWKTFERWINYCISKFSGIIKDLSLIRGSARKLLVFWGTCGWLLNWESMKMNKPCVSGKTLWKSVHFLYSNYSKVLSLNPKHWVQCVLVNNIICQHKSLTFSVRIGKPPFVEENENTWLTFSNQKIFKDIFIFRHVTK